MSFFNQTNSTNFRIDIPDSKLTEAFTLNVQSFILPDVRIPITEVPLGTKGLGRSNLPGSTLEHGELIAKVLLDEELISYIEIYKWMLSINNYITHNNSAWDVSGQPEGIILHILDNDKKKSLVSFNYYGAWPSSISDIEYGYDVEGDPAVYMTVNFNFKYFEIEKDNKIIISRPSIQDSAISIGRNLHPSMR
ncbi:tail completion and sheath stabilizer protein [Proteus phage SJ_PmiM]|nr:tail completion and sheath stabilizer protein [Proteus phage SJ_PmiM]